MRKLERSTDIPKRNEPHPVGVLYDEVGFRHKSAEDAALAFADKDACVYGRIAHPNTNALARIYSRLEDSEDAIIFSSGMAATTALILATCEAGDFIVASSRIYGGTYTLLKDFLPRKNNIWTRFINEPADLLSWEKTTMLCVKAPKLFILETPGNPLLNVYDIEEVAKIAKKHNAIFGVDNTMGLGIQKPLDFGADVSFSSLTKVATRGRKTGGVIAGSKDLILKCLEVRKNIGFCMDHEVALRIAKDALSLSSRMKRHSENAYNLSLEIKSRGYKVNYPGFNDNDQSFLVNKQMGGYGGVLLSFEVDGGQKEAMRLLNILHDNETLDIVTHFGEDKITTGVHPASTTHSGMNEVARRDAGISDGLIRISTDSNKNFTKTTLNKFIKALDIFERIKPT